MLSPRGVRSAPSLPTSALGFQSIYLYLQDNEQEGDGSDIPTQLALRVFKTSPSLPHLSLCPLSACPHLRPYPSPVAAHCGPPMTLGLQEQATNLWPEDQLALGDFLALHPQVWLCTQVIQVPLVAITDKDVAREPGGEASRTNSISEEAPAGCC